MALELSVNDGALKINPANRNRRVYISTGKYVGIAFA